MATLIFHSRSKCEEGRYLSNFTAIDITIDGFFDYDVLKGKVFPSIEHAFQGAKLAMSGADDQQIDELISCNASEAQRMGQKKYFDQQGLKLDVAKWSKCSIPLMRYLVKQRIQNDEKYKSIIEKYHLYHFSRAGKRSLWGGYFSKTSGLWEGQNLLGKIMKDLKNEKNE